MCTGMMVAILFHCFLHWFPHYLLLSSILDSSVDFHELSLPPTVTLRSVTVPMLIAVTVIFSAYDKNVQHMAICSP